MRCRWWCDCTTSRLLADWITAAVLAQIGLTEWINAASPPTKQQTAAAAAQLIDYGGWAVCEWGTEFVWCGVAFAVNDAQMSEGIAVQHLKCSQKYCSGFCALVECDLGSIHLRRMPLKCVRAMLCCCSSSNSSQICMTTCHRTHSGACIGYRSAQYTIHVVWVHWRCHIPARPALQAVQFNIEYIKTGHLAPTESE